MGWVPTFAPEHSTDERPRPLALRGKREKGESADKPGSVEDNHSSGMAVASHLKQPTRIRCEPHRVDSYLALLQVGFA